MFTQLVLQSTKVEWLLQNTYEMPCDNVMKSIGPIALNGPNSWPFTAALKTEQTISAKHLVKFPLLLWSTCFFALIYVCKLERNIAPLNKIKGSCNYISPRPLDSSTWESKEKSKCLFLLLGYSLNNLYIS